MAASASAHSDAADTARLAGSFNGWNPTAAEFTLSRSADRESLTRWWPCGIHDFKFTFGGGWEKHWGDDGRGGLTQPGGNIRLVIPTSRVYTIALDRKARKWTLAPAFAEKPKAVIELRGAAGGARDVLLDARLSAVPRGQSIQSCKWAVRGVAGGADVPVLTTREAGGVSARIRVPTAGSYSISLTIKTDAGDDSTNVIADLGRGYSLLVHAAGAADQDAASGAGAAARRIDMQPLEGGQWGCVYLSDSTSDINVSVAPACDERPVAASARLQLTPGRRMLIRFDAATRRVTATADGWHEFTFDARDRRLADGVVVERVELVGDFNEWQPGRHMMIESVGTTPGFRRLIELPDGRFGYKLLVNGTTWLEDANANATSRVADGAGGFNSVLRIGPDAAQFGAPQPNQIAVAALAHDPHRADDFLRISRALCDVRVRTLAADVERVLVAGHGVSAPGIPLRKAATRNGYDYWSGRVALRGDNLEITIIDGTATHRIQTRTSGASASAPARQGDESLMSFETPDWAKSAVWYQIFPERFCNGEPSNDPPRTVPWTHDWFKPYKPDKDRPDGSAAFAAGYEENGETFYHYIYDRRYGGDIQGIRQKLPYLRDLGVNALYLNPIFLAESLHKYDASDYRHVDDYFGVKDSLSRVSEDPLKPDTWKWSDSDKVFLEFVKEAHRMGFRVVLDGVFNHVGREFWAFQDVLKHKQESKFADWFDIKSWKPFHYYGWWGEDNALPRLKHSDTLGLAEPVREHIFAITRRWMAPDGDVSAGIDGWRLDVAPDINEHFWRDWRTLVKSINPQAYLSAEIWTEARHMLRGDQFDAVMNYEFAKTCQRFFVNRQKAIKPTQFARELEANLSLYPPQVNLVMMNLFDSHDTDRVASMMLNPDHEYDGANRLQDTNPRYNAARPTQECYDRVKLAVTFQMMHLGAPMIWYGNEVGMFGADDPTCRKPMLWPERMPYDNPDERIMPDVWEHHRRMIAIRNTYRSLQLGAFVTVLADDNRGIYAFERRLDDESVLIVLNNSDLPRHGDVPAAWPAETSVARLDDPSAAEVSMAAEFASAQRAIIRLINGGPRLKVSAAGAVGISLPPRSAAVLAATDARP